jgi:2-polyprenyl-3-methyl-5-hydroxy-6-metoxy-1,4-benzoquinol methylase
MQFSDDYRKIAGNYRNLTWIEKFIVWTRFKVIPIKEIIREIPLEGKILDLGCGFGVFSYFFAFRYPRLSVEGIDPSRQRIGRAKNVFFMPNNLKFFQGHVDDPKENDFAAIVLIDVICYLTEEQQIAVLKKCYEKIKDDGVLIIKTMNKAHLFKYLLMAFITKINTFFSIFSDLLPQGISVEINKVFGQRKVQPRFYFPSEFKTLLESAGWKVKICDIVSSNYPDIIYFCRKSDQI